MRPLLVLAAILAAGTLASAQVTVVRGYASNQPLAPEGYAVPFVPLVTTPSVSLESPAQPVTPFAEPIINGAPMLQGSPVPSAEPSSEPGFHFGAAQFQSSYGAAQLANGARIHPQKARLYTNQDVEALNSKLGTVKYGNKTEHVD